MSTSAKILLLSAIFAVCLASLTHQGTPLYSLRYYSTSTKNDLYQVQNVTFYQNVTASELVTIQACGVIQFDDPIFDIVEEVYVQGRYDIETTGSPYSWTATIPVQTTSNPSSPFCFNYTAYLPDLNQTRVDILLTPTSIMGWTMGGVAVILKS